jgi:hypothetical protein
MKQILFITTTLLLLSSCKGQPIRHSKDGLEIATIKDMETHVPVPSEDRDIGYDSIQLLVQDGKITANFCYPNGLRFKKDTVYTGDTAYRLWGFRMQIDKDLWLTKKYGAMFSMSRGTFTHGDSDDENLYLRDSVIIDDTIKVSIQRLHK